MAAFDYYISLEDLDSLIKSDQLEVITRSNPTNLTKAIVFAQSEIEGYINSRYDVATLFAARGNERHPHLCMIMCDIAIYHAYSNISSIKIPPIRMDRYDAAIEFLKKVASGTISPNFPPKEYEDTSNSGAFNFGGARKRDTRY